MHSHSFSFQRNKRIFCEDSPSHSCLPNTQFTSPEATDISVSRILQRCINSQRFSFSLCCLSGSYYTHFCHLLFSPCNTFWGSLHSSHTEPVHIFLSGRSSHCVEILQGTTQCPADGHRGCCLCFLLLQTAAVNDFACASCPTRVGINL